MKLNETYEATLWGMIGTVVAACVVVAGAVWVIAQQMQSEELQSYRVAQEWKIKEAIDSIAKLSKQAALDADERSDLLALRNEKKSQQTKIDDLSEKLRILNDKAMKQEADLKRFASQPDVVEVPIGESHFFLGSSISVGCDSTFDESSMATVYVANNQQMMHVGQSYIVRLDEQTYLVTLTKVVKDKCTFALAKGDR